MAKNMLIGQSGGPTAAINASLAGAVQAAMQADGIAEIYGSFNGLEGVLRRHIIDLRAALKTPEDFELLKATPAMALGSCRLRLAAQPDEKYRKILETFRAYGIGCFFYIGGNDSMDSVRKLHDYFRAAGEDIRVVGIPKTIDNDLPCTDHTPGFPSAAKFVATSVAEIACDSFVYDRPSVTIAEIMGRNAGWLTAASVLSREAAFGAPHLIYLPESDFDPERFLADVRRLLGEVRNVIVAVAEGIRLRDGRYVSEASQSGVADAFGHKDLAGAGKWLERLVRREIGCKVRSVELNVLQRSAAHLCSDVDIREAQGVGAAAVRLALAGHSGVMATISRSASEPYAVSYGHVPVGLVANQVRNVPREWITPEGGDVTGEMLAYLRPLVQGENPFFFLHGVPRLFRFARNYVHPGRKAALSQ